MVKQGNQSTPPGLTTFQALTVGLNFGITLGVSVAALLIAGQWLDSLLGTSFVFTLIGVALGFAAAITGTLITHRLFLRRNLEAHRQRISVSATNAEPTPPMHDRTGRA